MRLSIRHGLIAIFLLLCSVSPDSLGRPNASLAILKLHSTSIEVMGDSAEIDLSIVTAILKAKGISLMPRREMEEILRREGIPQTGEREIALAAGRALGVDFVLFGSATRTGTRVSFSSELLHVHSGTSVRSWEEAFSGRKDLSEIARSLVAEMATAMDGADAIPPPPSEVKETAKPDLALTRVTAELRNSGIDLRWNYDPALPINAFRIYRSESRTGPFEYIGTTGKNVYRDSGVEGGHTYYYAIGMVDADGKETRSGRIASAEARIRPRPYPPNLMPGTGHVRRTAFEFIPSMLNDREGFKIAQYIVRRRIESETQWEEIQTIRPGNRSQMDIGVDVTDQLGLQDGATYTYCVSSVDESGQESPLSRTISIEAISSPVLSIADARMTRSTRLSWDPVPGVDGYSLYRMDGSRSWQKIAGDLSPNTSRYTDTQELTDGQRYHYRITAYDAYGETGPSNTVVGTTKEVPSYPNNLLARSGMFRSIAVSWEPGRDPDIGGYTIYRGTSRTDLQSIERINEKLSASYVDSGTDRAPLADGKDYYYAIASFNTYGTVGERSPAVLARTKPRPADVRGVSAVTDGNSILLEWQKNPEPDITHYIVVRSRNSGKPILVTSLGPDIRSYRDEDIRPEDTYTYGVIAENADQLKSEPSEAAPVVSQVKTVLSIAKDDMLRRIDLSWQPLKTVSGYHVYRRPEKGEWDRIARIGDRSTTQYSDDRDLRDGAYYEYRLTSFDREGESQPSNTVGGKTKDLPACPKNVRAAGGQIKAVEVLWDAIDDPDRGVHRLQGGQRRGAQTDHQGQRIWIQQLP